MALQLVPVIGEAGMELVEAGANKVGHMSGALDNNLNLGSGVMDLWNAARPTHPNTISAQQVALQHQQHQQLLRQQQLANSAMGNVGQGSQNQVAQISGSQVGQQAPSTPATMDPMLQQNPNMVSQLHNNVLNQSLADVAAINNQLRQQQATGFDQSFIREMPFQTQLYYGNNNFQQQQSNSIPASQSASNSFLRPTQQGGFAMQQLGQPQTQIIPQLAQANLNTQSNSKVNFAPQPHFKMYDNQSINVPKPNNAISFNAQGTPEQQQMLLENPGLMAQFNSNVLAPMRDAAIGAGLNAAQNVGTNLVKHSATKAEELAIRYGQAGMNKATSSLGSFLGKIIGDALPNLTAKPVSMNRIANIRPEVRAAAIDALTANQAHTMKVIGDAPPGSGDGVMSPEQQDAALNNISNSPMMLLMSEIILQEQMLYNARSLPRNMDRAQVNRQMITDRSPVAASFTQEQFTLMSTIRGTASSSSKTYINGLVNPPIVQFGTNIDLSIIRAAIGVAKISPPLGGSTLVDSLKGLILGESISNYSSDLRLKTVMSDVDRTLQTFGMTANMTTAGSGYSFMLPLLKMLLYACNAIPIIGEGKSHETMGLFDTFPVNVGTGGNLFVPFTGRNVTVGDEVQFQPQLPNNVRVAVINERSMIDIFTGNSNTADIDNIFHPRNWGQSVAVVFVQVTETEMRAKNSTRIATQIGYPVRFRWEAKNLGYVDRTGAIVYPPIDGVINANSFNVQYSNQFLIEGPSSAVLFVIVGPSDNQTRTVSFGYEQNWTVNTDDDTIDEPLQIATDAFYNDLRLVEHTSNLPTLSACIRDWERDFGNNSNRSEAMRICADVSRRYFPQTEVLGGLTAGSPMVTSAYVPVETPAVAIPITDAYPDWPMVILETATLGPGEPRRYKTHHALATTATGIKPMHIVYRRTNPGVLSRDTDHAYNPVHYHLPRSEYLIDYLILKKQMFLAEEYPDESLSDLGRVCLTIAIQSNIIAGCVDLLSQANNISQQLMIAPEVFAINDTPTLAKMENVMYTSIDRILTSGIQTPGFYLNLSTQLVTRPHLVLADIAAIYGQTYVDGLVLGTFARIARHDLAQFSPSLEVDHNSIALSNPNMYPSKNIETVNDQPQIMYQILTSSDEMPGISQNEYAAITNMMSRLSMGQVMTAISTNPGIYLRSRTSPLLKRMTFTNINYDSVRSTFIAGQPTNQIYIYPPQASNKACPMGQNVLTRDPFDGHAPLRMSMAGPADMFLGLTYNYYQVQAFTHGSLAYTTTRFQTIPDNVFTGNGLNNALAGF